MELHYTTIELVDKRQLRTYTVQRYKITKRLLTGTKRGRRNGDSLLVENKSDRVGEGVVLLHDGERGSARILQ